MTCSRSVKVRRERRGVEEVMGTRRRHRPAQPDEENWPGAELLGLTLMQRVQATFDPSFNKDAVLVLVKGDRRKKIEEAR